MAGPDQEYKDGTTLTPLRGSDILAIQRVPIATHYKTTLDALGALAEITETAHGFSVGEVIGHDGANWVLASALVSGDPCLGLVVEVVDIDKVTLALVGVHTMTSHGFSIGQNYLSTTPGQISTTQAGPGNIRQRVLVALDANTILLTIGDPLP
jgi:hypothetical protein